MSLEKLTQKLKSSFESQEYDACLRILPLIKIELAKHQLLVPIGAAGGTNEGDLLISRSILEIGALSAINTSNLTMFEKFINELKPFYALQSDIFQKNRSINEKKLIALYLLLLLTKGQISQFHIELLTLSKDVDENLEDDYYLNYPIKIERWLMEGSYDKIWKLINSTEQAKNDNFKEFYLFNKNLNDTLRIEIAKCLNVSYKKLPLANAKNLLFFENEKKLLEFTQERTKWKVDNGVIYFDNENEDSVRQFDEEEAVMLVDESVIDKKEEDLSLGLRLIWNTLGYAAELETIV